MSTVPSPLFPHLSRLFFLTGPLSPPFDTARKSFLSVSPLSLTAYWHVCLAYIASNAACEYVFSLPMSPCCLLRETRLNMETVRDFQSMGNQEELSPLFACAPGSESFTDSASSCVIQIA